MSSSFGVRTGDDGSALVEQRQQVAQAAATAVLVRDALGVHGVDTRLGPGERQPGERVEQVVQAFGPRFHATRLEHAYFIVGVGSAGRHEAHRPAAFGAQLRGVGKRVQMAESRAARSL